MIHRPTLEAKTGLPFPTGLSNVTRVLVVLLGCVAAATEDAAPTPALRPAGSATLSRSEAEGARPHLRSRSLQSGDYDFYADDDFYYLDDGDYQFKFVVMALFILWLAFSENSEDSPHGVDASARLRGDPRPNYGAAGQPQRWQEPALRAKKTPCRVTLTAVVDGVRPPASESSTCAPRYAEEDGATGEASDWPAMVYAAPRCCICMDVEPSLALVPCGHLCLCDRCVELHRLTECPICRRDFEALMRVEFRPSGWRAALHRWVGG